jgi:acyl carrier protein
MTQAIFGRLQPIFREILEKDDLIVVPELSAADVDNWDSLAQIQLIVAIEKEFKIRFVTSEMAALKNVGDMAELIQRKLAA